MARSNFCKKFCDNSPFKKFKPHNMYKREKANTKADHDRLEKQGYGHSPYKKQKESFGDKVTRKLGGGKKIAGCKYNPGG